MPVLNGGNLEMSYYGARQGVTYIVETSSDLMNWGTDGVVVSGPNASRTASLPMDSPMGFLRLVVEN